MMQAIDTQYTERQTATAAAMKPAVETKAPATADTAEKQPPAGTDTEVKLQYSTDRVEISEQALAQLTAEAEKAQQTSMKEATEEMTETTASTTPVLTSLTEQQLENLVDAGSITRAQANTELARRATSQNATEQAQ